MGVKMEVFPTNPISVLGAAFPPAIRKALAKGKNAPMVKGSSSLIDSISKWRSASNFFSRASSY
jgi:hypothetical protein